MQNILRKNWFWPLATVIYFFTRLINLKIIPIFTDEAIYARWAQIALHDPANRFLSLEDGKQPLFIWLAAISQKFIADPLVATRLVSVVAGFGSAIGIYLLSRFLLGDKTAKIATFLYIILPFTLLYDRMALFDSLLTMLSIYSLYFSTLLAKKVKLDLAILAGVAIGLAMITKSSGVFFLYLLPFSLIFFNWKSKDFKKRLFFWFALVTLSSVISQVMYNFLRLSPLFYIINRKNLEFIRSSQEVIASPFAHFFSNATAMITWQTSYLGAPLFTMFIFGLIFGFYKKKKEIIYLSVVIFMPFLATCLFNKVLYPRFMLFYFPAILIIVSYFLANLLNFEKKYSNYIMILIILSLSIPAFSSFKLLTDPPQAKIAESDKGQYINSWPAGYGVKEIVKFLKENSQKGQIYIGTEGTFGLFPYALNVYFFQSENVHILAFWPVNENNLPDQITNAAKNNKTYFVFNENQKEITSSELKLVAKYQKGVGNSYMRLFEVLPQ